DLYEKAVLKILIVTISFLEVFIHKVVCFGDEAVTLISLGVLIISYVCGFKSESHMLVSKFFKEVIIALFMYELTFL
ncbi:12623_t:CDS:1, partial [Cetraspora pellucida]